MGLIPRGLAACSQVKQDAHSSDTTRLTFFGRCTPEFADPDKFLLNEADPAAMVTYPVRCCRVAEILALYGLLMIDENLGEHTQVADFLSQFVRGNPGTGHPISDRWAASLAPTALLLWIEGHRSDVETLMKRVIQWIGDRYEGDKLGLAESYATPEEEIQYLLGNPFEHVSISRRSESYVASVILDLASALKLAEVYDLARNDFLAVDAMPALVECPDSPGQFLPTSLDAKWEANMPYADSWQPTDEWKVAPHHLRQPEQFYLERIGRGWDQLAIAGVMRDRHSVSLWFRLAHAAKSVPGVIAT